MRYRFASGVLVCAAVLGGNVLAAQQRPAPVVLISLDGMKPEYVTQADQHHLRIPTLRSFLTEGSYATGVTGVIPTVTYPSHTTMVTGVWPAEHGVYDNTVFDPLQQHPNTWYWDFADIKVPTLYTAADGAGLKTANVGWPVTVGAPIDYNIAEGTQSEHTDKPSASPYHPADILDQIGMRPAKPVAEHATGDQDVVKTAEAVAILRRFHPDLLLVHLSNMDHQEHEHSPFSKEANASLEVLDGQVRQISDAALAVDPATRVVIVSDHGFLPTEYRINLNVLLARAGLIDVVAAAPGEKRPTVKDWQAEAWPAGGSNAIVLRHPEDAALVARVKAVLDAAAADPANGIATVLKQPEIRERGGFPDATFLVDFKEGFTPSNNFAGPVRQDAPSTGMHGYLPSRPEMRSAFMVRGKGIAAGRNLGVIDMRQIAPTLAQMLSVSLPTATHAPLKLTAGK